VLLFGVGEAETEGIYSLRAMSRDDGLPQDTIVAFEDPEDAERCVPSLLLSYASDNLWVLQTSSWVCIFTE
jgi:hypothetical protein